MIDIRAVAFKAGRRRERKREKIQRKKRVDEKKRKKRMKEKEIEGQNVKNDAK